ncbi:hypothetical protein [Ewingella americana]
MKTSEILAMEKLIAGFNEVDNEQIYQRTSELDRDVKLSHIRALFEKSGICDLDSETLGVAMDSVGFQEKASAAIWDLLVIVAQYERARVIAEHREAA